MVSTEMPTVLLRPGARGAFAAENVVTIDLPTKSRRTSVLVLLFAGAEPAQRFLLSLSDKGKGATVFQLASPDALGTLLADLKTLGTTHVNFTAEPSSPNPIPIDDAVSRLGNPYQW